MPAAAVWLVILYSTSAYNGEVKFQDAFYYLKKQLFAAALGIAAMYGAARVDYHFWRKLAVPGYLAALLLSVAVLLVERNITGPKDGCLWARFLFSRPNLQRWR